MAYLAKPVTGTTGEKGLELPIGPRPRSAPHFSANQSEVDAEEDLEAAETASVPEGEDFARGGCIGEGSGAAQQLGQHLRGLVLGSWLLGGSGRRRRRRVVREEEGQELGEPWDFQKRLEEKERAATQRSAPGNAAAQAQPQTQALTQRISQTLSQRLSQQLAKQQQRTPRRRPSWSGAHDSGKEVIDLLKIGSKALQDGLKDKQSGLFRWLGADSSAWTATIGRQVGIRELQSP